ncbi:MAG TPA: succinyldiaminopimelate transaminase [Candidatus Agrococcus pullicola]|uniref:Succinyldiaminopimelate transaminase n=1 Tax=Candidatus Agrococcus pullicola TaxID=2838429 RepID=A0A9D1YUX0_9MICO|nr:succinyldiaminopimelate transaminase [Candidatus Agrococcus pullicola]
MALQLPDFPWDSLADAKRIASEHPDGLIDLSVGSPVDPTPAVLREALSDASNAHGYPQVWGTPRLREAIIDWFGRIRGVPDLAERAVMPSIGSKELIAGLALWLGLGAGDTVVIPEVAYPTYDVSARLVGSNVHTGDDPAFWPESTKLVWLNSPSNPTGRVLGISELRAAVARARELGAVLASDECYALLPWDVEQAPSVLDPRVTEGDTTGLLAVHSLSKQSSDAGYRTAFIAGDEQLVQRVVGVRKHLGLIPPAPVQSAMIAALDDDEHVAQQRERYRARRETLLRAVREAGWSAESDAGLYIWAGNGDGAREQVRALAGIGILVAPGDFYGDDTRVRIALTATDAAIERAAARLRAAARSRAAG